MKIAFSILHYGDTAVTEKCIESLLKLEDVNGNYIVIVNNGTENQSWINLYNKYSNIDNIFFIQTGSNLGFAKGNNFGYYYAKKQLSADVICVMNNDVTIEQVDFIRVLKGIVDTDNTEIIAPVIIDTRGSNQNPLRTDRIKESQILWGLIYNLFTSLLYVIPGLNYITASYLEKRRNKKIKARINKVMYDIVPHGAAIIYNKKYVDREDIAFLEETFLFGEEDFLYEYITQKGYRTEYNPSLIIKHNEDASIKSVTKSFVKKRLFISRKKVVSLIALMKYRKSRS